MYISKFTDYAFRSLIYLALNQEKLCTVDELAETLKVSQNHIKKIVHKLAKGSFIYSIKGRTGGIRLAHKPEDINLAEVILYCDELNNVIECSKNSNNCTFIKGGCKLKPVIDNAINAFLEEFKNYTLKDIL